MKTGFKDQDVVLAVVKTNICIVCRRCTGHSKQLLRNDGSVNICSSIALIQIRNTATTGRTQPLQMSRRDDLRMCLCAGGGRSCTVDHGRLVIYGFQFLVYGCRKRLTMVDDIPRKQDRRHVMVSQALARIGGRGVWCVAWSY